MPINDEIFARMDELSPAEKKVARTLLAAWPSAGLDSAASLARSAGTSTPTVLRLVARLGFGTYPAFQAKLRDEVAHHMGSPVQRTQEGIAHDGGSGTFARAIAERVGLIEALRTCVPPSEFDRAVAVLGERPKHVAVIGGYFSRYFGMVFAAQLDQILPDVAFLAEPLGHDVGRFLRLRRGAVVVVIDFRRHELAAQEAAAAAKEQGATVVVITDTTLSPAAESADVVLPVTVDGIPFDSMAPLLVLIEALVEGVLRASGRRGLARMKEWEDSVRISRAHRGEPTTGPRAVGAGNLGAIELEEER
ncbi:MULTISPECIES: MurR/RpiR family transcriptional regulator [unclassified Curtobacterium]|uniref:MurR/RpiR family transcriptional regulator n=1 Tax=unclassified Curtobacterium TaxID=257496 RepID=UPI000DA8A32D|nr:MULTISPECIES: MurR/RpiR family transcriptional regulator [unclassified Curtobacterium]PZE24157.1 MurR/RpiR family transcriptional regulator [Curtobacterium sp. MCBD17_028]PZE71552.1 MurR/RpiR family transcriptional regulator [Curtobacterium sp. MCBD17_019]PZF57214.1 MurR/RpiR family transcriptional regulator [Curtobacterium sp. MCBD17_013]WIB63487.1 MurR/RpiR family transcriptional regulator [Curtobacterium sp. MCBD17_040]WIB67316.1 MurR/RpiR family transcriptional regulator [Curtobacterium